MKAMRPMILCGIAVLASIGFAAETARAQAPVHPVGVRRPQAVTPRVAPARVWRNARPWPVRPHTPHHRDWTIGQEHLPLAKPWLHGGR